VGEASALATGNMAAMLYALPMVGLVLGLVLLIAGAWAVRSVWRLTRQHLHEGGRRIRVATVLAGVAGAVLVSMIKYYPNRDTMIYGFPFVSFVFERRNGQWLDFVGPLTVPALLANASAGFVLPFVVVALHNRRRTAA
jgi:hypothetical protein